MCFHLSSFMLMWVLYDAPVAIAINIILAIFLYFFISNGMELLDLLYITDDQATSNSFGVDDRTVDGVSKRSAISQ